MARPGGRPGDYPGDPLELIAGYTLYWLDTAKTQLRASWIPISGLEVDSRWIKYLNGIIVGRSSAASHIFTVPVPGVTPNLAVVAVPAACDQDGAYDPLSADPSAVNLFPRNGRVIVKALVVQRVGNRSGFRVGFAAALSSGNRSSLGIGVKVGA
jgi:hypothetical protein